MDLLPLERFEIPIRDPIELNGELINTNTYIMEINTQSQISLADAT